MKVSLADDTGAIGRFAVPALVAADGSEGGPA
jgi:hypothetical protein